MSDPSLPVLQAEGLYKWFGSEARRVEVLKGVEFTLKRGEMAALLGVSGSGKSTLLQIMGGLDRPSAGTVRIDGEDLHAMPANRAAGFRNQRIGFVYQSHRLLPEFSALENVMMPLLIARIARARAREEATILLNEVGLGHRLDHRPGQMSGGEQQRVAIARALVTGPGLLLADEPTGNLDRKTALEVFRLLRELNARRGLACLMVTHNPELAVDLDRRLHLVEGVLTEERTEGPA
ncbi:Lipoprotein-releasing system ATP-binding [Candidatus Magnetaquicoccaceae bacterium FCR-1]|uniref:Lipoprotein-releasing system ATP-binding n=1 Tax=Candidatus Magnetaquiglobus chichijimensis TaxID=3141448 RepID=A0ABQ0C7D9_9PROT